MALENILSSETIQRLGWTLLHFVWQATAVAMLAAIVLAGLRKATAGVRYLIACGALGLIVVLPIVTMALVSNGGQPQAQLGDGFSPTIPKAFGFEAATQPTVRETPVASVVEVEEPPRLETIEKMPAVPWKQRAIEKLEASLPYLVAGWLIGVFGLSLWHLGGWAQLQRLRRHLVKPVDASLQVRLNELATRLKVSRAVQLLESALVHVPTVVGWLRPVILLPASALTGLNTEQLEALLAHELAHIRRYDYLVNMLQTIVETLGFYHPAVWWVSHKIRVERENCCDDVAVSLSGDRVRYAKALTSMEEIRAGRNGLAVAATGGSLLERIGRLVGKDTAGSNRASWIPSVITILLIAVIVIPTTLALTAHNETELSAQSLLDKMLEHRAQVRNLQYAVGTVIWQNPDAKAD
ncbi:MAG: M56 family metallopeptidase, partial [Sedimentisphaerales bacterium]